MTTEEEINQASMMPAEALGTDLDGLAATMALDSVKGLGPQRFRDIHETGESPASILSDPGLLPGEGARIEKLRMAIGELNDESLQLARARAARQMIRALSEGVQILTLASESYPVNVRESNNPVPILWTKGPPSLLAKREMVACVGSRAIREPYASRLTAFTAFCTNAGFGVASGFATGADRIGHEVAYRRGGETVLVMPSGLDRPFPPENRDLWDELLRYDRATMVSEFPLGTSANALNLRKRNKLIVAFARSVLIAQSASKGGAMNAYRFAIEQRKSFATFQPDSASDDVSGNAEMVDPPQPPPPKPGRRAKRPIPEATAFSCERDDPEAWERWLRAQSSST